jgi:hypothetical protein
MVASLKALLAQYCGTRASTIQIMITETNSVSYNPGKQTTSLVNALFLTDQVMTWLENGVANVDWWAVHNSPFDGNVSSSLYGSYNFGDYGILSRGFTTANGAVEPPANTPYPAYYGLQMLSQLGHHPRDTLLQATSSTPLVSAHAVKQTDGSVHVMLVNKDPSISYTVTVAIQGAHVHGRARVSGYGINSTSIDRSVRSIEGSSFPVTIGPYSVTTIELP